MAQLSSTMNPRQPGTLPSNTLQHPKNDIHCMTVTTQGRKQTIDPSMLSVVEDEVTKNDDAVEASG